MNITTLITEVQKNHDLPEEQLRFLLEQSNPESDEVLFENAREVRQKYYGKSVYVRGLIEFTNYCKNDCLYCGIRKSNANVQRYRLSMEEIANCCQQGYDLGYRTFVLQGGEDGYYTKERIVALVEMIKHRWPDCAVTLSVGERSYEDYQCWYDAGADRYLLRHETATKEHYEKLHPPTMFLAERKKCLQHLKEIGYQVGAGFMVGSPYQTTSHMIADLRYLQELQPHMIGIGPFISQKDTPFAKMPNGTLAQTLRLLAILRIMFPDVLLPATTALGTIHPKGRELGLLAGANVVMPNLSPKQVREKYTLYDNKICTGEEAAECNECLVKRIHSVGYDVVVDRGDCKREVCI